MLVMTVLWETLQSQRDLTRPIPLERFDVTEFYESEISSGYTTYVSKGYFTDGAESFDYACFGISNAEALQMDPQQRMAREIHIKWPLLCHVFTQNRCILGAFG